MSADTDLTRHEVVERLRATIRNADSFDYVPASVALLARAVQLLEAGSVADEVPA